MVISERIVTESRIRTKDGIKFPSVTSYLKLAPNDPKLQYWIDLVGPTEANRVMNLASQRGEIAHKYIQDYFTGVRESYDVNVFVDKLNEDEANRAKAIKKMQGFITSANLFLAKYGKTISVKPENIEKELFFTINIGGKEYNASGRLDILPDKFMSYGRTMMDFKTKTSLNIHDLEKQKWGMQLALYAHAVGGVEVGVIVILTENGRCDIIEYSREELDKYFKQACDYIVAWHTIAKELNLF